MTNPLRFLPTTIVQGAVALPDGSAVGLVSGGPPALEFATADEQRALVTAYRQILLGLQVPLHVYHVDQPVDMGEAMTKLLHAQLRTTQPVQAMLLGELADRLAQTTLANRLATKQVVWAVGVTSPALGRVPWSLHRKRSLAAKPMDAVLEQAVAQAQQLADKLALLGGQPAPHLPAAEAIAQLWYRQLDPIRADQYPLRGDLVMRMEQAPTPAMKGVVQ